MKKGFSKVKISDSFKEFISKCKSKPIDDFAKKTLEEVANRGYDLLTDTNNANIALTQEFERP